MLEVNGCNRRLSVLLYASEPEISPSGAKHVSRRAILHIHHFCPTGIIHTQKISECIFITGDKHAHNVYVTHIQRNKHTGKAHHMYRRKAWVWPSVCTKWAHKSGGSPAPAAVPGRLRSHPFSWWLPARLPSFNSPHCPTFALPPQLAILRLGPYCPSPTPPPCPYLLPTPPLILHPLPPSPSCFHFPD